jgi:tetratricopeptide (TPR) repeat protein
MTITPDSPRTVAARTAVAQCRGGDPAQLAEALETFANAAMADGDLASAASALEEAASLWDSTSQRERQGNCLLLAATTQRLRGDLGAARLNLDRAKGADLPPAVRSAFKVEEAEQALLQGDADEATSLLTEVLAVLGDEPARAQILQRRAAAAVAAGRWREAAADLMDAEDLYSAHNAPDEAEAAALGAAAAVANVDPETAERVWAAVSASSPRDGGAAAQRGIIGGRVAMLAGDPALALKRFDAARQGALDSADPFAYLAAVAEAVQAAETLGDDSTAYARLATAWATIGDLLGAENGRQLVRPQLEQLRDRLGPDRFNAARTAYEQR